MTVDTDRGLRSWTVHGGAPFPGSSGYHWRCDTELQTAPGSDTTGTSCGGTSLDSVGGACRDVGRGPQPSESTGDRLLVPVSVRESHPPSPVSLSYQQGPLPGDRGPLESGSLVPQGPGSLSHPCPVGQRTSKDPTLRVPVSLWGPFHPPPRPRERSGWYDPLRRSRTPEVGP